MILNMRRNESKTTAFTMPERKLPQLEARKRDVGRLRFNTRRLPCYQNSEKEKTSVLINIRKVQGRVSQSSVRGHTESCHVSFKKSPFLNY